MVEYLPPGISDHSPMKVICDPSFPSGPLPFKYFESWESVPSFHSTVHEAWKAQFEGNPMFKFVKKLAHTMMVLKRWNVELYGPIHHKLSSCKRELDDAQAALHQDPCNPLLMASEQAFRANYTSLLSQEEQFARQKLRQLWLAAGDSNTKFFYNSIKSRSARNTICRLHKADGSFCSNPEEIKDATVEFYRSLLNRSSFTAQPLPPPIGTVTEDENASLCSTVLEDELH
ncbi:hypothetical protein QJS10_CPB17g01405 [Acorus calamus]|uniref:Uncharacterized protein n=1 Tax=Acorus calamus TaxID=4465 RepID=A0AAV9CU31_ACOCL|nr:hypothetical protein QJS10_CPB17g01405 [Acorus calamus]